MGDFNEDGHTDLVTANFYSDSVGILLGYGDGTFQNAVTYPSDGSNPSSVSVGDFNGDGYADLVTANVNSSTVGVLLGNGNGTFQNAVTYPSGGSNPRSVSVGDFNEDGHTDLVTVNSYSNSVSVLLGNGDGTFQNAVTYPSDGSNPSSVSVGDFNEDGHTDLVTANYISGTVGVLLGGSNATTVTVTSPAVVVTGQSVPFTITVAPVVSDLGTASGTVTLYNGGTVLGTGTLDGTGSTSIVVSPLPVGTYNNITAVYDGDATLAGNTSSPVTLTVNKADTTVSLTSSANPSVFGQSTTFTATVSVTAPGAGSPSGAVTFYDGATVLGTTALSGGTATFSLDSLDVNNHSITAEYNGDGSFHTSISTATTQTVSPAQLTVTVASLAGVSGSPLPAFTYTVNGLVNGDPEAVVSGINLTSPATPISLPGTYPIIARGGMASNYAITYVDGTLTLTAAPPPTAQTAVSGSNGSVQVLAPDGSVAYTFTPFAGGTGAVRTAVTENGHVIVGTGPGVTNAIQVIDPQTQAVLFDLNPFETTFTGGVFVSSGDLLGLGSPQVIVSPDQGGGPRVQIRDGQTGAVLMDFFGIDDPNFRGGVQTAIADVTGDHIPDLIVAAGMGGGPRVTVYDGAALREQRLQVVADLFVFEETLRNGVSVTAGDVNGDGYADLIVGGGPGSGPRVLALSGHDLTLGVSQPTVLANFFAGDLNSRSGIRLTVKDLDGDAYADLLTAPGPGGGTQVTAYAGKDISPDGTPPELFHYDGDADSFDGIFIG